MPALEFQDSRDSLASAVQSFTRVIDLQNRKMPPPVPFDGKNRKSIDSFFSEFEAFCNITYPYAQAEWSRLLPGYLTGEAKVAFESIEGGTLPYATVKEQLKTVFKESSQHRDFKIQSFFGALKNGDESIRLLALRLNKLVVDAFPEMDEASRDNL